MRNFSLILLIFPFLVVCGCKKEINNKKTNQLDLSSFSGTEIIEIAPDEFVTIGRTDRSVDDKVKTFKELAVSVMDAAYNGKAWTHIGVPWNGKLVQYKGGYIPICLREYQDKLYMIGFDRETDSNKIRFRFYKGNNDLFQEIDQSEFPKQIAVQNMWFTEHYSQIGYEIVDHVQATIELNPSNLGFFNTTTAELWLCLLTRKEYYEIKDISDKRKKILLRDYKEKFNPIKLTTIVQKKNPRPIPRDLEGNPVDKNGNPIP